MYAGSAAFLIFTRGRIPLTSSMDAENVHYSGGRVVFAAESFLRKSKQVKSELS